MTAAQSYTHALSGDAGIKAAQEVAAGLKDAIARHSSITIDTGGMTAADITTVQTLLAARKGAAEQGKSLTIRAPLAAPLVTVLGAAGFLTPGQPHLDFWPSPSSGPRS